MTTVDRTTIITNIRATDVCLNRNRVAINDRVQIAIRYKNTDLSAEEKLDEK